MSAIRTRIEILGVLGIALTLAAGAIVVLVGVYSLNDRK